MSSTTATAPTPWYAALAAGASAGTAVDVCLFPLDTIKTRLQTVEGFRKAGGFTGVYRGLGAAAAASAPAAAVFFQSYVGMKAVLHARCPDAWAPAVHMGAAAAAESMSALVRVPFEVVKQQMQARVVATNQEAIQRMLTSSGMRALAFSYLSLLAREIPFALIQYPTYEYLKSLTRRRDNTPAPAWQLALCGSLAGGFSAACTTPLDVAKTRVMLASTGTQGTYGMVVQVARSEGVGALFSGIAPRVMWISIGGAVFFGVYEKALAFFGHV